MGDAVVSSLPMMRSMRFPSLYLLGSKASWRGMQGALRDDGLGAAGLDVIEDGVAVIGLVGDDVVSVEACQQRDG